MAPASASASEQQLLSAQPERRTELRVSDRSILWAFEYVDLTKGIANCSEVGRGRDEGAKISVPRRTNFLEMVGRKTPFQRPGRKVQMWR